MVEDCWKLLLVGTPTEGGAPGRSLGRCGTCCSGWDLQKKKKKKGRWPGTPEAGSPAPSGVFLCRRARRAVRAAAASARALLSSCSGHGRTWQLLEDPLPSFSSGSVNADPSPPLKNALFLEGPRGEGGPLREKGARCAEDFQGARAPQLPPWVPALEPSCLGLPRLTRCSPPARQRV